MKFLKKIGSVLLLLGMVILPVHAEEESTLEERDTGRISEVTINTSKTASLTVNYESEETEGLEYQLYMIAEFEDNGRAYYTEDFWNALDGVIPFSLDAESAADVRELAETIRDIVKQKKLEPVQTRTVNGSGQAVFTNLRPGYYLGFAEEMETETTRIVTDPSLLEIPNAYSSDTYDTTIYAKHELDEINEKLQNFEVIKKWIDGGANSGRPEQILVQLLRDGEAYGEAVALNANNRWRYTWHELSVNYTWTAVEIEVPEGYYILEEESMNTRTRSIITNKKTPEPDKPKPEIPFTGVLSSPVALFYPAGVLLLLITRYGFRKKKADKED